MKFAERPDYIELRALLKSMIEYKDVNSLKHDWLENKSFWSGLTFSKDLEVEEEEKELREEVRKQPKERYRTRRTTRPSGSRSNPGAQLYNFIPICLIGS